MPEDECHWTLLDAILAAALLCAGAYVAYRIAYGIEYHWDWSALAGYLVRYDEEGGRWVANALLVGLFTTLRISLWATVLATVLGTAMACARLSASLFGRTVGRLYVETVRNLPPLVLVFVAYFFLSDIVFEQMETRLAPVLGWDPLFRSGYGRAETALSVLFGPAAQFPLFLTAVAVLAVYEGAYITEIVRAGIQSIATGQWEASASLGLTWLQQMRTVILPQAARRILPALGGQFISTIKDSAIVSLISIPELTFQGREVVASTYMAFEVWITVTALYLVLTLGCSLLFGHMERRMRVRAR
jgi:polar amino acid transport system permease protein